MKLLTSNIIGLTLCLPCMLSANKVSTENVDIRVAANFLNVSADIVLDSLSLPSNRQIFITPVIKSADSLEKALPSLLVNGRNMHISYQRGVLKGFPAIRTHEIGQEIQRDNGKPQTVDYTTRTPLEDWMRDKATRVAFVYDSCGCGASFGEFVSEEHVIFSNPAKQMRSMMIAPPVTPLPVEVREGKARIQFEVNRTELHAEPYTCKNGQRIDNRAQLALIDDSVHYALTDPNVELAGIAICGYASPESPYTHNETLATGRSKALAEYLAEHYNLDKENVNYSAVAENWVELRKQVEESKDISEQQRADLLGLIDIPAQTPEDWDRKEHILKTDPRFRELYLKKILPEWFPRLRATTFAIHTRLKPMSDEELAKVLETTPEKMSLNQMFRVSRLYPEGSEEFNKVIKTALLYYPSDPVAILNAATADINAGEYEKAKELLKRVEDSPEVYNLLGIIATADERYDDAKLYFEKAGDVPQASHNLDLLK